MNVLEERTSAMLQPPVPTLQAVISAYALLEVRVMAGHVQVWKWDKNNMSVHRPFPRVFV
jgi:hypothetical protein